MADEKEILAALFAASLGSDPEAPETSGEALWQGFLARLAAATHAESALLRLAFPGRPAEGWQVGLAWEGVEESVVERMRSGRVYSQVDLPGGAGGPPLRALRWRIGREARVLIALRRRGEDFRAVDGLQLANLTPYLGVALTGWRQLEAARTRAARDRQLAAALGAGWLLLAPSGQVLELAEGLAGWLETEAGIALRPDGRLSLSEPAAQELRQALAAAAQGRARRVMLAAEPAVELWLAPESCGGETRLVGRLRHGLSARGLPPGRLAAGFGLSRSEARLAACLCDGLSLAEAAEELGWTPETARSTSKQVFARMGVRGQTGVVRRVLESGVWWG
ncbi:helix-turn-helix transcriptional regulator [Salipiger mangrovisoli]|uniref:HTH luxR-type domain-containing protein n=1 Tax=Salipiger mangrovisoli TaxID=2865933 RepID=A0ABR9X9M3_9RHOB|nr:hypothetical protein [Salipiger mangrovisoli]MBE9640253.1 hypothetical protein [Salipiger mangrovisoli]